VVGWDGDVGESLVSATWLWVRADLRRRWRSWMVLGLLAGVSMGLASAGVAGARRTADTIPTFVRQAQIPDAAVLANDVSFDAAKRAQVAALPNVRRALPFVVPFALEVEQPKGLEAPLVPASPATAATWANLLVEGRVPDPRRDDEVVVNEVVRDRFGLDIGRTATLIQRADAENGIEPLRHRLRVVGVMPSPGDDQEQDWAPSSGFYRKYRDVIFGPVNQFVDLERSSPEAVEALGADVERIAGHPVNVASADEIFGIRKLRNVSSIEEAGLLLFAVAVLIGAGVLVGQALVRAVSAGASDLPTWRAMGADRGIVVRALVAPTLVVAAVGVVTSVAVAIALSPRFPIALTRGYDFDIGLHADWFVLLAGAALLVVAVLVTAWITAEVRVRRHPVDRARPSALGRLVTSLGLRPSLVIGSRLAVEPGTGRRAVPVRSALVGAIAGVLGVVGCLTFRAGIADVVSDPTRSGVVWDVALASSGFMPDEVVSALERDPNARAVVDARWARAVPINGRATPTFGVRSLEGRMDLVVVAGRAPRGPDELAIAPTTMDRLGLRLGERVRVGADDTRMRVVGKALLPSSSHTDYDESAWMAAAAWRRAVPREERTDPDAIEHWVLVALRPGTDPQEFAARSMRLGAEYGGPAEFPSSVESLGQLRSLPLSLAVFFGLLAIATVAHALVTTVRRRRHDLAVLRSIGFTRTDTRVAIAWQSTLIAVIGTVVGVPLGIVAGRLAWRQLAESFPVVYAPPVALVAVLLVIPLAIVIANLVAAGPAHAATRIRPATALRTE
jgi:ABC-type lipoprotein release transport system permease subunit